MSELRELFLHERRVRQGPHVMMATPEEPLTIQIADGREYFSREYVEWLECELAAAKQVAEQIGEAYYRDPTLLDRRK